MREVQAGVPELNVAAFETRSPVAGPGRRFVLWVQGCPLRCAGCVNQEFQPFVPRMIRSVDWLAEKILAVPGLEGVTYTGGEPMAQARGLATLSERVRRGGLTVVCYTGYTLEALRERGDAAIGRLLEMTDILIDGPYVREKAAILRWRGSSNQRVHFLTGAYRSLCPEAREAEMELRVGAGTLTATGVWPEGFVERLTRLLGE
jgi:anaerobic ribonucleoside-triphosphate reductase activating protein